MEIYPFEEKHPWKQTLCPVLQPKSKKQNKNKTKQKTQKNKTKTKTNKQTKKKTKTKTKTNFKKNELIELKASRIQLIKRIKSKLANFQCE